MNQVSYTVGIPVRNEENTLQHCVQSALCQQPAPKEVLICLNGSNDETHDVANELRQNNSSVKLLSSAPGKPNAWNEIVRASSTNLIYFTDGDAQFNPDAAQQSIASLQNNPDACVTGGDLKYLIPPSPPAWLQLFSNRLNRRIISCNISGANYMIRRDDLIALGSNVGVPFMPTNVIHEDVLIGTIARRHCKFAKNQSLVSIFPPSTLPDYVRSHLRYKRSMHQLDELFPEYFANGAAKVSLTTSQSPRNRLLSCVMSGVDSAVNAYISIRGSQQSQQWTELKSTKPRLNAVQYNSE